MLDADAKYTENLKFRFRISGREGDHQYGSSIIHHQTLIITIHYGWGAKARGIRQHNANEVE